jgi:predicted regulator of Ras-like GTPase activity (Roadblock/LC7/MglB family)
VIALALPQILDSLPADLASLAASPGAGTFSLPVKTALAQLASGAVRIPFGELRQGSPPGTFYNNATQDRTLVTLPLPQILASLDPALLARRSGQKMVAVPESVTSIFGLGRNLQAPLTPAPAPVHEAAPASAPRFAPKPPPPQPGASPFTRLPKPAPLSSLALAPAPGGPSLSSPPASRVEEKEVLSVALSLLSESWPPAVLQAIAELQLENDIAAMPMIVALPMNRLERGLKTGRVVIPWGELSQWLQPPLPARSLANREEALELPLKVVAPLFLARRRPGPVAKKLTSAAEIPSHIPNLFGRTVSGPEGAIASRARVPTAPPAGSTLDEVFGVPGRLEWTPQEICRRICALEGVAGSALAMSDGLVVAAHLPAPLNPDTVAAFLPQIFARVSQSAGEMQLGPLTGIVLAVGQARCAIYKTGRLYLAVLGRPGAALPEPILGRIAAELAKRNP